MRTPARLRFAAALLLFLVGAGVTAQTPLPLPARVELSGTVQMMAAQADGRVVIVGEFASVNGVARNRIARLNADGTLDPDWNPGATLADPYPEFGSVQVDGNEVWLCGRFVSLGTQTRAHIAAIDIGTGRTTAFDAHAEDAVYRCAVHGDRIYVSGAARIGGVYRQNGFVALDRATGLATSWAPPFNGQPVAFAFAGGTMFVAGRFSAGSESLPRVIAIDEATGRLLPFSPGVIDSDVLALAIDGDTLYAGGFFRNAGGEARLRAAAFDSATGSLRRWNPAVTAGVHTIVPAGEVVYLAGGFHEVGGVDRTNVAAVDAVTGAVTPWNPATEDGIAAVAVAVGTGGVFLGGSFRAIAGAERLGVARVAADTGTVQPLPLSVGSGTGQVTALAADGRGRIVAAGRFDMIEGVPRRGLARLLADGTLDNAFRPQVTGNVDALALVGGTLYLGGTLTAVEGQPRTLVAALDGDRGSVLPWSPRLSAGGRVTQIAAAGNAVFLLAEGVYSVNEQPLPVSGRAAIDGVSGAPLDWKSLVLPSALLGAGNVVYAAESASLVAYDAASAAPTGWTVALPSGTVNALALSGSTLFAAGSIVSGPADFRHGVAYDVGTRTRTAWRPFFNGGTVAALAVAGNAVYAGGSFTTASGRPHPGLAQVDAATGEATLWRGDSYPPVSAIVVAGGLVWSGGSLYTNDDARVGLAALPTIGSGPAIVAAIEYYHAEFDHYFVTANPDEIAKLDAGGFAGWKRTGQSFPVYSAPAGTAPPVCRFFSTAFGARSSHFYTASAAECGIVQQNPDWTYEGLVFHVLPAPYGSCLGYGGSIYRLYNNGQGGAPNHRYTADAATRAQMQARGWISEANGDGGAAMCGAW